MVNPQTPEHVANNSQHRVLVTGGAGFIGSHVVDALIEHGYRVFILDNLSTGSEENVHAEAKLYKCDLTDHKKTAKYFEKIHPNFVFHFAAQINVRTSVENPVADATTNVLASIHLMELSKKFGVRKFIFSSTGGAIYGDTRVIPTPETTQPRPLSPYAIAKLTVERYLRYFHRMHHLDITILRYANVYGPRQNPHGEAGVVAVFLDKMLRGENPTINGDGLQTRDYVYVADVVAANILALERPKVSGIFNIGTSEQTTVNEVFDRLNRNFDRAFQEQHGPAKEGETRYSALATGLAQRKLGWRSTVPFAEGLSATVLWFKSKHREKNS